MNNLYKALAAAIAAMPDPKKNAKSRKGTMLDRFERRTIRDPEGCWLWIGNITTNGYGQFGTNKWYAHRWSYEHFVGPIPEGMTVDHMCGVRNCVRPSHLRVLSIGDNVLASPITMPSINKMKTECPQCGSGYTTNRNGRRFCRNCANKLARERQRQRYNTDPVWREQYREKQNQYAAARRASV